MLLLSSLRSGSRRRASLLLLAAVLLGVIRVGAGLPAVRKCPDSVDCALQRRHFCKYGSSHCGPCLSPFEENEDGRCVLRTRRHQRGKVMISSDLDDEIDFLDSVIEKQEVGEFRTLAKQSKHPAVDTSQTDIKKSKTDATRNKPKSQDRLSVETEHGSTAAAHPAPSALPNTPTAQPRATKAGDRGHPLVGPVPRNDSFIVILISLFVVVGTVAVVLATVCFVKLRKESHLAQKVDYPAFGRAGVPAATANGTSPQMGDRNLAQSAQMFHYQHQKQQMLSLGNNKPEQKVLDSEVTSDEEEVGGDFTVYECPGLAPTGEMEVKNPLFDDSALQYQGNPK